MKRPKLGSYIDYTYVILKGLFLLSYLNFRGLERKVRDMMADRHDYQAYYFRPYDGKYARISKEAADYLESIRGD